MRPRLALKVDVDTERGTRVGLPNLLADLRAADVPATFFLSLGPDRTGRAITRIFRPGFLGKVARTNVVRLYGWRTLLNGTLLPAPHIARRHGAQMREVVAQGHEAGIHCYDHYRWQDHVHHLNAAEIAAEFAAARREFAEVFGFEARAAAAPGWQANALSRECYDRAGLLYSSDTRGTAPYFPRCRGRTFSVLEIPTTLPTLDELLGRIEFPRPQIIAHLMSRIQGEQLNVFTLHAEIEGMGERGLFRGLLDELRRTGVEFVPLQAVARDCHARAPAVPVCEMRPGIVDGRTGQVAVQGPVTTRA